MLLPCPCFFISPLRALWLLLFWWPWLGFVLPHPATAEVPPRLGRFVFALGDNSRDSTAGAIENARLVPTLHPGWGTRFYVDATNISSGVIAALQRHGAEVVMVQPDTVTADPALWPFWAADVSETICIREVLGRPSLREAALVGMWLRSSYAFHTIRDHYFQLPTLEPHLWCAKAGQLAVALGDSMRKLLAGADASSSSAFMHNRVYPTIIKRTLRHDAYNCDQFHPLPVVRRVAEFIGQRHNHLGARQKPRHTPSRLFHDEKHCTRPAWLHLISQIFLPESPVRRQELIGALHSWLRNPNVFKVHLMGQNRSHFDEALSGLPVAQQEKAVFIPLSRQMLYEDAFGYASQGPLNDTLCMILNSDIGLGVGFHLLGWEYLELVRPYLFSLSRHPSPHCMDDTDQCVVYIGSHDAFLFVPPVSAAARRRMAFRQNLLSAENAVMYELRRERKLWNPCKQLHIHHFHCSGERPWRAGGGPLTVHRRDYTKVSPQALPFPIVGG